MPLLQRNDVVNIPDLFQIERRAMVRRLLGLLNCGIPISDDVHCFGLK